MREKKEEISRHKRHHKKQQYTYGSKKRRLTERTQMTMISMQQHVNTAEMKKPHRRHRERERPRKDNTDKEEKEKILQRNLTRRRNKGQDNEHIIDHTQNTLQSAPSTHSYFAHEPQQYQKNDTKHATRPNRRRLLCIPDPIERKNENQKPKQRQQSTQITNSFGH
mmetsp:Transcript_29284/g.46449  ORF Transcript_29284/g.46449 Transcript_29284/m.46449 type:complete len:166 (-) Transcript_29284:1095-1592(-)